MKYALISPTETREVGYRVAEVAEQPFEIAQPLFWVECPDEVTANTHWYNHNTQEFEQLPEPQPIIVTPPETVNIPRSVL